MNKVYYVENLLDTFDWVGRNINEVGVDDSYVNITTVKIEGNIFGVKAKGFAQLKNDFTINILHFSSINIFIEGQNSKDIVDKLEELYGKPYIEGTDPYVESQGGAIYWKKYYVDKGVVTFSITSKTNVICIKYQLSPLPQEIKTDNYN